MRMVDRVPPILALTSGACSAALLVQPYEAGCGELTLHWVVLEPTATALGLHGLFVHAGPLGDWVGIAPLFALGLAGGLLLAGFALLRRDQRRSGRSPRGLVCIAMALWGIVSSAWAGLWWLAVW